MSFDWQTEETVDWQDPPPEMPDLEDTSSGRGRRVLKLGLFFIFISAAFFAAYHLLGQQIERASDDVESDLLASYTVVENAARAADGELFTTFLSGRDMKWARDYEQLVAAGHYYDRSQFGLSWQEIDDPVTAVISTTTNATFDAAEIVSTREYSVDIGNGLTESVRLRHTAVYRLGSDRWLLAPPEDVFWGETLTKKGFYMTLNYPERDKAFAEQLAIALDSKLGEFCSFVHLHCGQGFQIEVSLTPSISALEPKIPTISSDGDRIRMNLPTPTLVGLPLDETAHEALIRGYLGRIIQLTTLTLFGDGCCRTDLSASAMIVFLQVQLGLRPYPLSADDWQNLAENISAWKEGVVIEPDEEQKAILSYAIIDFFLKELHISLNDLLSPLMAEPDSSDRGLSELIGSQFSPTELEKKFFEYVAKRADEKTPVPRSSSD